MGELWRNKASFHYKTMFIWSAYSWGGLWRGYIYTGRDPRCCNIVLLTLKKSYLKLFICNSKTFEIQHLFLLKSTPCLVMSSSSTSSTQELFFFFLSDFWHPLANRRDWCRAAGSSGGASCANRNDPGRQTGQWNECLCISQHHRSLQLPQGFNKHRKDMGKHQSDAHCRS